MIDIGANLIDPMFAGNYRGKQAHAPDMARVLDRAASQGVETIMLTAGSLTEAHDALAMARTNAKFFSTVGVHPTRAGEFDLHPEGPAAYLEGLLAVAREGVKQGKVVAVGECGLDYDRLHFASKETQLAHFERHFEITEQTGLPMFLHCRAAADDFVAIIAANRHRFKEGVVHSFDGSLEEMRRMVALGLHVGINACSLKSGDNIEVMKQIPSDRLMIETDAPWCDLRPTHASSQWVASKWPSVKKEKYDPATLKETLVKGRNEPCCLRMVLEVVAAARGEPIEELGKRIYDNTKRVFFPERG